MRVDKRDKNILQCGPGGMKCVCCGPAPGKDKRRALRMAKRRLRQLIKREIEKELNDE